MSTSIGCASLRPAQSGATQAAKASAVANLFRLANIFSRPLGGILSDVCCRYWGTPERVWLQVLVLFFENLRLRLHR